MPGILRLLRNVTTGAAGLLLPPSRLPLSFLGGNRVSIQGRDNTILLRAGGHAVRDCSFEIHGDGNRIVFGSRCRVTNTRFYFRGSRHALVLGPEIYMGGGSFWFEDDGCRIEVGRETSIQNAHLAATEPGSVIRIGEDCMLAYDIDIRTGDSHSVLHRATGERLNYAADVVIGDHVWIAAHCDVLKGVTLGSHSVIGTRAVVTRDVPPESLAVGVPARIVKSGITWSRVRIPAAGEPAFSDLPDAWCDRGEALARTGRLQEALDALDEAVARAPANARARYQRGLVQMSLRCFAEALAELDAAARAGPGVAWCWYDRGKALQELGRHTEAVRSFRRAVRIDADYPAAWYAMACSQAELGETRHALASLRRAVEGDPEKYLQKARRDPRLGLLPDLLRSDATARPDGSERRY